MLLATGARGLSWRLHRWRRAATPPALRSHVAAPSFSVSVMCRHIRINVYHLQNHSEDINTLTFRQILLILTRNRGA